MSILEHAPASRESVHRSVLRAAQKHGVALRAASPIAPTGEEHGAEPASTFQASVATMAVWCRVAERLVVRNALEGSTDAVVHAGFERLSRVRPVLERYRSLARSARSLDVYGEPDAQLGVAGLREVSFMGGPLASEWFLLVEGRRFKTILAGRDLDGFSSGRPLSERRFEAVACHHPAVVAEVREALEAERDRLLARRERLQAQRVG